MEQLVVACLSRGEELVFWTCIYGSGAVTGLLPLLTISFPILPGKRWEKKNSQAEKKDILQQDSDHPKCHKSYTVVTDQFLLGFES